MHKYYAVALTEMGYDVVIFDSLIELLKMYVQREDGNVVIVSALSMVFPFLLPWKRRIYIHHGFPVAQRGILKYILILLTYFFISRLPVKQLSVSYFTQTILKNYFFLNTQLLRNSIPVTAEINLPIAERAFDVVYVGRLDASKKTIDILSAFEKMSTKGFKASAIIICNAEEQINLKKSFKNIFFSFNLEKEKVYSKLAQSRLLISLNDTEPFGLVYLEALQSGCNVLGPISGGYIEISETFENAHKAQLNTALDIVIECEKVLKSITLADNRKALEELDLQFRKKLRQYVNS